MIEVEVEVLNRVIKRYDDLIQALDEIVQEDLRYVASLPQEDGKVITHDHARMRAAFDNRRRLEATKIERDFFTYYRDRLTK